MDAATLRQSYKAKRDAMAPKQRHAASQKIKEHLLQMPEFRAAQQVFFYVSMGSEVETDDLIWLAQQQGKLAAAPRFEAGPQSMVFHALGRPEDLEQGSLGVRIPRAQQPLAQPQAGDLILVPGLVFDAHGSRLGWGKGYYDHYLAGLPAGVTRAGLAYDLQIHPQALQRKAWDQPLQYLISESGVQKARL